MKMRVLALCLLFCVCAAIHAEDKSLAADKSLVVDWDFSGGAGDVLHDRSGNDNDGRMHGATWAKSGEGFALRFNGKNAYADCAARPSLNISGPITVESWVYPEAAPKGETGVVGNSHGSYVLTIYNGSYYWYISSGGNNCRTPLTIGCWQHVVGTFDGTMLRLYVNGKPAASRESAFKTINNTPAFRAGCLNPGAQGAFYFEGLIEGVRVYARALDASEVAQRFNQMAPSKRLVAVGEGAPSKFRVTPYFYPATGKLIVEVDYRGLLPLPRDSQLALEVRKTGDAAAVQSLSIAPDVNLGHVELALKSSDLPRGSYDAVAVLKDKDKVIASEKALVTIPLPDPVPPSPAERVVGALPIEHGAAKYKVEPSERGGFTFEVNGEKFPVESFYSYPGGGDNALAVSEAPSAKKEDSWTIQVRKAAEDCYEVNAAGKFYSVDRTIRLQPGRILVRDTFTNRTAEDLGIIMKTVVAAPGESFATCLLAGQREWGSRDTNHNPTVFVGKDRLGIGLMLMDDVSVSQSRIFRDKGGFGVANNMFGLAANKSHTVEWAAYPMESGDYFDFVNVLRKELGMTGKTLEGGFTFNDQPSNRRAIVPDKEAEILNLKYMTIPCMFNTADDNGLEIEGFEFTEFPKEMAALTETMRLTKTKYPRSKVMFHIAHSLRTTNKPERFADSRLINKNAFATVNDQVVWSNDYPYMLNYYSKKRLDEGYRWYVFYPTLENRYGKEMLRTVDVMMDQMGATGVFCDGFMDQYQGKFTYDRWDGHTVEIDPVTKKITQKLASVNLLAQDAYIEYCKRVVAKGGDVISDRGPGTLTFLKNAPVTTYLVESVDIAGQVHLTATPQALGCAFQKEQRELSKMAVRQLRDGCLYAHYYGPIEDKNIITYMYPITVEKIHSGWIEGRERIVTANSGVYGWRGDGDLHFVHFCDARGYMAPHNFVTTVDSAGVRTEIVLKQNETAVVKKIPVSIQSAAPVNVVVAQYDEKIVRLFVNGQGKVELRLRSGKDGTVWSGAEYRVTAGAERKVVSAGGPDLKNGVLSLTVSLNGQTEIVIELTTRPQHAGPCLDSDVGDMPRG